MRWLLLIAVLGCKASDSKPAPVETKPAEAKPAETKPAEAKPAETMPADAKPAPKPPDDMDEKMRHCPLALDGAVSTLDEIANGVRFTIKVPDAAVAEARRRAHHIVDFAAKKTHAGHGEFDGKGGGRMKNCPIVTDDVTITATDIDGGARLEVVTEPARVDALRSETRTRVKSFPFAGATISLGAAH